MDKTIIVILAIILIILIILNHVTIITTQPQSQSQQTPSQQQGNCSLTAFGCCPDGVNSKINFVGSNCPRYNPGPGYYQS